MERRQQGCELSSLSKACKGGLKVLQGPALVGKSWNSCTEEQKGCGRGDGGAMMVLLGRCTALCRSR